MSSSDLGLLPWQVIAFDAGGVLLDVKRACFWECIQQRFPHALDETTRAVAATILFAPSRFDAFERGLLDSQDFFAPLYAYLCQTLSSVDGSALSAIDATDLAALLPVAWLSMLSLPAHTQVMLDHLAALFSWWMHVCASVAAKHHIDLPSMPRVVVWSNTNHPHADWMKTHLCSTTSLIESHIFSCDVHFSKPDVAYFQHALHSSSIESQNAASVLFFDDRLDNLATAKKLKIHTRRCNSTIDTFGLLRESVSPYLDAFLQKNTYVAPIAASQPNWNAIRSVWL